MYFYSYVNYILVCSCNSAFSGYNGASPKTNRTMKREMQTLENVCRDIYTWIHNWPWDVISCVAIGLFLFIFFVASWFIRKEHIDKQDEEGSES
jgi:hypothetical protein